MKIKLSDFTWALIVAALVEVLKHLLGLLI
jgi:hypothetical protein